MKTHHNIVFCSFLAVMLSLWLSGCKTFSAAETSFTGNPQPGVVTLNAIGYGATPAEAERNTYESAFTAILFRGVPAFAALRLPMIENETTARKDKAAFFRGFFSQGYQQFIKQHGSSTRAGRADQSDQVIMQRSISINYEALRRHLENEGIIRKFGY